nr:electron transport complex subunit RsxB [Azohydromonas aeria]
MHGLAAAIDAALPQTQCTRCGYPDCSGYAQAVADGAAAIDRCPPGGAEGVRRLAALTGQAPRPLDAACGAEGPRAVAFIDEDWCIGCTLCLKACPVDCIAGATKRMHTVIESECTGCELCLPACPVDCIVMEPVTAATGWDAWSPAQAEHARRRYAAHRARLAQSEADTRERLIAKAEMKLADLPAHSRHQDPQTLDRKRAVIEAALARARAQRGSRV